jgi:hypothetical protein
MPYADKQKRLEYLRDWKRKKRLAAGVLPKGKHKRIPRTEEQIEISNIKRQEYSKNWQREYQRNPTNRANLLLRAARRRAKDRNLDFNLELSDIVIPTHCPYLGVELITYAPRGSSRTHVITLDRIDNSKGYIKGNIEVISHKANTMKSNATKEELLIFAKEILKRNVQ